MSFRSTFLAVLTFLGCGHDGGPGDGSGPAIDFATVATGLSRPLYIAQAPGDTGRLFILEQPGRIRIVKHGVLLDTPYLDLHDSVSTGNEQGLLGLAFAPNFQASATFYVHTTDVNGNILVLRYKAANATADTAISASRTHILAFAHPFSNHNSGQLAFGPDGYLYIGSGDGGGGGDPNNTGQDPSDLLADILRIDVSGDSTGYAIPPTNPFVASGTARHELWLYGVRNPWRFSFDRVTHDLWIGDVGQNEWEEIDHLPAGVGGQNLGWNKVEGTHCYSPSAGCSKVGITMPVFEYDHSGGRCSITGGYIYRGTAIPSLYGRYVYADYCDGLVRAFGPGAPGGGTSTGSLVLSFGEDLAGELYVGLENGSVMRLMPRTP